MLTFLVLFFMAVSSNAHNLIEGSSTLSRYMILTEKRTEGTNTFVPLYWRFGKSDGSFQITPSEDGVYRFTPHRMGYTFLSNRPTDKPGKLGPVIMNSATHYLREVTVTPDISEAQFGLYSEGAFLDMTHPDLDKSGFQFPIVEDFKNFDFTFLSRVHLPIPYKDVAQGGALKYICAGKNVQSEPCPETDKAYPVSNQLNLETLVDRLELASQRNKKVVMVNGFYSQLDRNVNGTPIFVNDKPQRAATAPLHLEQEQYEKGFIKFIADLKELLRRKQLRISNVLSALVLEEENYFPSKIIRNLLEGMYKEATKLNINKDLTVLQWYAHSSCSTAIGDSFCTDIGKPNPRKVSAVKGDGYLIEQYLIHDQQSQGNAPPKEYSHYVEKMSSLNQRLVSNVWASPNWAMSNSNDTDPTDHSGQATCSEVLPGREVKNWWNVKGWKQFYTQVTQNLKHKVPTALYMITLDVAPGKCTGRAMWRINSHSNAAVKAKLEEFMSRISNITIPALKQFSQTGAAFPDVATLTEMPAWIPKYCPDTNVPGCSE